MTLYHQAIGEGLGILDYEERPANSLNKFDFTEAVQSRKSSRQLFLSKVLVDIFDWKINMIQKYSSSPVIL